MRQLATCFTLLTISLLPAWAQQDVITTAIGGGPNDILAVDANLNQPNALAVDSAGNYYISAIGQNRVFKVSTAAILTVLAGNGTSTTTDSGDGVVGGAPNAQLNGPNGLAVDSAGDVYISEYYGCTIRKVDTTNTITTIAGTGSCGYSGDNGPATAAKLNNPRALATDTSGNLYVADYDNCRIRKIAFATGIITTVAGDGSCSYSGDNGLATSAGLAYPGAVSVDNAGDVFIGDFNSYRIREVTISNGYIYTVAGNGVDGYTGDGGPATSAEIGQQYQGLATNSAGTTVTITDFTHQVVRQFTVTGIPNTGTINTIAGNGKAGYSGDGGPADDAEFNSPKAVALASSGSIYVADNGNNRVREFAVAGIPNTDTIGTVAGNGSVTFPTLVSGVPPSGVVLNGPNDVLVDPSGNVFISEYGNCMVRELVKKTGVVNIFAGSAATGETTGSCGFSGEGGAATNAELGNPAGIARDSAGNIYISDFLNCVVWQVSPSSGVISVFAGVPKSCGDSGDGGPATSAELHGPAGIFVDRENNLYISDSANNRIREVSGGTISTIAGDGTPGYLGDGDPATIAELKTPYGVTVDSAGNVYIGDYGNCIVREVTAATGIISPFAGIPTSCGFDGDGPATQHQLNEPTRLHLDDNDNLFIADDNGQRVRWVSPAGVMTTIAGNGTAALSGDGGPATSAELYYPNGVAQDASGNYLIADYDNLRIREVTAFAALNTSPSGLDFELTTVGSTSGPQLVTLSALGPLTFSNISVTGPFTEYDDCGAGLANGKTCTMYVYFKPTAAGTEAGTITIEDNGFFSDTATISLTGTGSAISVTGGPLVFGGEPVDQTTAAKTVTVSNSGTKSISMGAISVDETDFTITNNTCTGELVGGKNCTISVAFAPKTTGAKKGSLVVDDSDPSSPQIVGLTGTGTSTVTLNPSSLTFSSQAVGTTGGPSKVTLTNKTGAALTLGNAAVSLTGPFSLGTGATSCRNKQLIAAGGTCFIYVDFTPTSVGFFNGTLSVSDSDPTSPQTVALSGTGTGVEFTPASVSLASTVGHQVSTSVSLVNVGSSTITFTAATITGTNAADWSTNNGDPPCKGSLAPGALCSFTVYFTPSIVGTETATYSVYDNSTGSPQALPLSGTGQ